ncbi:SH3 domain-containing protein [Chloroflexota bacterium]
MNTMTNKRLYIFITLVTIILLTVSACSSSWTPTAPTVVFTQTAQTPTKTAEDVLKPLPSETNTAESTPAIYSETASVTATPAQTTNPTPSATYVSLQTSYSSLPPGQYVVYHDSARGEGLWVVSIDGTVQKHFSDEYVVAVTAGGKKVGGYLDELDRPFVIELETETLTLLPKPDQGCDISNASPGLSKLAVWCRGGEIHVFDVDDEYIVPIALPTNEMEYYSDPQWSPDGRWIAYFNRTAPFETDPGDGLYLVETTCLAEPDTCQLEKRGPFLSDIYTHLPYSWSPNSQQIAFMAKSDTHPIQIFDLNTETFHSLNPSGGDGFVESLAWSPDGEWIAYSRSKSATDSPIDIFITDIEGVEIAHLVDTTGTAMIYFWLTVPWPFLPGDTYQITQAGANLNLRQSPDIEGNILQKLQPGDVVRILEGPVVADGYNWWQLRVVDSGAEGWAVEHPNWYEPTSP